MAANAKRVKGKATIKFQVTDKRLEHVKDMLKIIVQSIESAPYPREYINPGKGDYIEIEFTEPKPVKS